MSLYSASVPNLLNGVSQQPDVLRHPTQGETQSNMLSSPVEGLRVRPPAEYHSTLSASSDLGSAYYHFINRDPTERYILIIKKNEVLVYDILANTYATVATPDGTGYVNEDDPDQTFRAVTVADYTFIVNTKKTVVTDGATLAPSPLTQRAFVTVAQGQYDTIYRIFDDTTELAVDTTHATDSADIRTTAIAGTLQSTINGLSGWTAARKANVIEFHKTTLADFDPRVEDSIGGHGLKLVYQEVSSFADLPDHCRRNTRIRVRGSPETQLDDYYVNADVPGTNAFGPCTWRETDGPGSIRDFDPATMPHILVRETDGTFTFKRATWGRFLVGDNDSNPVPSFVGRKIADVFFFKNRLGLISGENVSLSRAGNLFHFGRTTVTQLLETDPIDVQVSTTKVANLKHAINLSGRLILFSDNAQFELDGSPLSPQTAAVIGVSDFATDPNVRPISSGNTIFFAFARDDFEGVREFYMTGFQDQSFDAEDLTAHVPHYIPGEAFRFAHSDQEQMLFVLNRKAGKSGEVNVYKYFYEERGAQGGREKSQSSWSNWVFRARVVAAHVIDHLLYLVIADGTASKTYLLTMDLRSNVHTTGYDWKIALDFLINSDSSLVTKSFSGGNTTFTLPYRWTSSSTLIVVAPGGAIMTPDTVNSATGQVVFNGQDLTAASLFFGLRIVWRYEFSRPVVREKTSEGGPGAPITEGILTVLNWAVNYVDTGYFEARVIHGDSDRLYTFSSPIVGDPGQTGKLRSGTFKFPIRADARKPLTIRLSSLGDNPYPAAFVNAGWEGLFTMRSRRF